MHLSKISFLKSFLVVAFVFSLLSFFSFKEVNSELIYNGQFPGVQVSPSTGNPCGDPNSEDMVNFDSASMESCEQGGGNSGEEYYPPEPPEPIIVAPAVSDSVTVYVVPEGENLENGTKGIITAEKDSCIIEDGKNTCDVKFTWSVTNPDPEKVATVKRAPVDGPVINQNSGSEILPVYYWLSEYDTTRYVLFIDKVYTKISDGVRVTENGKILSQAFVKATCKDGSSWVPSLNQCVKNPSVKKFSTPNCTIPIGGSNCDTDISWEVLGGYGDFSVTTPNNITVGTGKTGIKSYPIEYPSRDFYLYNNGTELKASIAYANCQEGSDWSVGEKKCVKIIKTCPNGATNPPDCTDIPKCPNGATNPPICNTCVAGTTLNPSTNKCECNNGATNPPACTIVTPQECPVGTTWNELSNSCLCDNGASNPPACNLFGTLSKFDAKDCSIKSNESTCQTKLDWISTLLGSFAITTPEQITVSTASSGTDVPYAVEYPSRKFFAYNNSNLVEEKTAYAKCEDGSIWSTVENKCVPGLLCAGDLERDVYFDCPAGYGGKIIRKQIKIYPECVFPEPVTEENSILINNNCKLQTDPSCGPKVCDYESCEGDPTQQINCSQTCEGEVISTITFCPPAEVNPLNIDFKSSANRVLLNKSVKLTWTSDADECVADSSKAYFETGNSANGSTNVAFKQAGDFTFGIICKKGEITDSREVTVKVNTISITEN